MNTLIKSFPQLCTNGAYSHVEGTAIKALDRLTERVKEFEDLEEKKFEDLELVSVSDAFFPMAYRNGFASRVLVTRTVVWKYKRKL